MSLGMNLKREFMKAIRDASCGTIKTIAEAMSLVPGGRQFVKTELRALDVVRKFAGKPSIFEVCDNLDSFR